MSSPIAQTIEAGPAGGQGFPGWVRAETRAHSVLYSVILAFVGLTFADALANGETMLPLLAEYAGRIFRSLTVLSSAVVTVIAVRALVIRNDRSPLTNVVEPILRLVRSGMLLRYLYASLVLAVFMAAFLYHKMNIPALNGFRWDATFAEWDLILFAGRQPWEILQPYLGFPVATVAFDFLYSTWVPLVFIFWAGLVVSPKVSEELRSRYWTATVVSWILIGIVMATYFSSAGPCFFTEVVPGVPSPFAGLNAYLAETAQNYPLSSTLMKDYLWASYIGQIQEPGGISAMPSMHNAQAALFAAAAYSIDRRFGHVMLAYAAVIFVGSIHLAWHYAVDGIVGIAAALFVWFVVSALARRQRRIDEVAA